MTIKTFYMASLLLPFSSFAQNNFAPVFDKYMNAAVAANNFSGNVLVAHHGKIIYQKGFGLANRDWNIPNSVDTRFKTGSLTKQFTAAAILLLVEEGKLSLKDKLSRFYPDFPKADSITMHMLLNHSSGIKDFTSVRNFNNIKALEYQADSIIAISKNQPFDFSPGMGWSYNNAGYFLLGTIIEKLSGKTYETFLQQRLFNKAGLKNTGIEHTNQILPKLATSYVKVKNGWKVAPFESMEFPFGSGTIYSTVEDMFKWSMALFNAKIISQPMLDKMTSRYRTQYGYGMNADSLKNYRRFYHAGGIAAFFTISSYYPDEELYIVVFSNNRSNIEGVSNALASVVFNLPFEMPVKQTPEKINPALFTRYVGRFKGVNTVFEFALKNNQLFRIRPDMPDVELVPESNSFFFSGNGTNTQFKFIVDKDGSVNKVEFYNLYRKIDLIRINN